MANIIEEDQPRVAKFLHRAYGLDGTSAANSDLYDEWANSYDEDNAPGYASPRKTVEVLIKNMPATLPGRIRIFDAGCGTGLVGDSLNASPYFNGKFVLDGADISAGMLKAARSKGVYRELGTADLNERIEKADGSYDLVLCIGTMTKGHVGPQLFAELARLAVPQGLVVATVHGEIWEKMGFKQEVERLKSEGVVDVISTDDFGFLDWTDKGGIMVVLRKK